MVTAELISKCRDIISNSSDSAYLDAKVIVKKALNLSDTGLIIRKNDEIENNSDIETALKMAELRKNHMPVAYITGYKEFMSLKFFVSTDTLIPRPDTECIVEKIISDNMCGEILDIGTGSGAIAVSLAKYLSVSNISAIDISDGAIETAEKNASVNGVSVNFIKADIFEYKTDKIFDCIVSNPPYIETREIDTLIRDVKDFEPLTALDGGYDGLEFYRKIAEISVTNLKSGGSVYLEHGYMQFASVKDILLEKGFTDVEKIYDLAGRVRGCKARFGGKNK